MTARLFMAQAGAALGLRVLIALTVSALAGEPITWLARLRDGASYLAVAHWLAGGAAPAAFDLRVFPGLPLLLAPFAFAGLPLELIALVLTWLAAALVAPLTAIWGRNRALGWAAVVLTPSWAMYSTHVMSEPWLLTLALGAMLMARRDRAVFSGALMGAAGLMRPMACFAALGSCVALWLRGQRGLAIVTGGLALAVVLGASMLLHAWGRYGLMEISEYSRQYYGSDLFSWPGLSLLRTTAEAPLWKSGYVWLHVALTVAASLLLALRAIKTRVPDDVERALWLGGNTAFVLCVGNIWGFHEFHRFILPALPPLLGAYAWWLERANRWAWLAAFALSFGFSVFAILPH